MSVFNVGIGAEPSRCVAINTHLTQARQQSHEWAFGCFVFRPTWYSKPGEVYIGELRVIGSKRSEKKVTVGSKILYTAIDILLHCNGKLIYH